ncbi:MAG: hypothetical protein ABIO72_03600 [Patescibacteria group bacterium]
MAKNKLHPVSFNTTDPNIVGSISMREIDRTVRKPLPPATQRHRVATDYRRKPKHPHQEVE